MRVQVGKVVTLDPENMTARVKIEEQDDKVSAPLHVIYHGSSKDNGPWMPELGNSVLCIFTKESEGFIIGKY